MPRKKDGGRITTIWISDKNAAAIEARGSSKQRTVERLLDIYANMSDETFADLDEAVDMDGLRKVDEIIAFGLKARKKR